MGHIFISYSHKDTVYAHELARSLNRQGFEVWIDERLDYGSSWPQEIQKQLDSCSAFLLVMTSRSFASDWVQSELQRAKRKLKPIFPLLLEGDEPWLSVESIQFYDVRGGIYPDPRFYAALRNVITPGRDAPPRPSPKIPPTVKPSVARKPRLSLEVIVGLVGALATLCAAFLGLVPFFREWIFPHTLAATLSLTVPSAANAAQMAVSTTSFPEPEASIVPTVTATAIVTVTDVPAAPLLPSETTTNTVVPTIPTEQTTAPPAEISPSLTPETPSIEMILVPEGEFTMGKGGIMNAKPVHSVYVASFYMDTYEVTNALYKACAAEGICALPFRQDEYNNPQNADHPVVFVTWKQAKTYCEWRGARLPTEAEWEKAARGNQDDRSYPWGNSIDCTLANYSECDRGIEKVGSHEAGKSMYGIHDLAGNVSEWVSSLFKPYPYNSADGREDPNASGNRVLRGGNWNLPKNFLFAWYRNEADPNQAFDRVGFRCVQNANP